MAVGTNSHKQRKRNGGEHRQNNNCCNVSQIPRTDAFEFCSGPQGQAAADDDGDNLFGATIEKIQIQSKGGYSLFGGWDFFY